MLLANKFLSKFRKNSKITLFCCMSLNALCYVTMQSLLDCRIFVLSNGNKQTLLPVLISKQKSDGAVHECKHRTRGLLVK
jgi:hypothetical protein